ncbi:sulfatase-like hydrolase/transferase [Halosquirtibacter laminarini]|uniref:Sulfatase-like hydrolase/transferase n=1 Tax=Halosquirtibacter laminarini TaxID=3374600 RepID=A0AC61NC62_9BACT|nr:sulfatase-like hydrolase/transferase [Prolixibacteraceae bacterium]
MIKSVKRVTFLMGSMLLILQLCRILFVLFNYSLFQNVSIEKYIPIFLVGLRYDIATLCLYNTPLLILFLQFYRYTYNKIIESVLMTLFVIVNTVILITNLVDVFYFAFTLKRITFSIFDYLGTQANMESLGLEFLFTYWYAFVLLFILLIVLFLVFKRSKTWVENKKETNNNVYPIVICFVFMWGIGMKGCIDISSRCLRSVDSVSSLHEPITASISLNSAYSLWESALYPCIKISDNRSVEKKNIVSPVVPVNKNVIVIILESFTAEASKLLNSEGVGYTPFLDSLMQNSYYFSHATANGRKSIDALPAVFASIPAMQTPYILQKEKKPVATLPKQLSELGYETYFFHGSHNATMGFRDFCKFSGVANYRGLDQYPFPKRDFDGTWGIWDEPYLKYMAHELDNGPKPFFSTVFTLTSHNPFVLPSEYNGKFPQGENGIEPTISYTDHALRMFFKEVSLMPWYNNTLFVITADHSIKAWHKNYATSEKAFHIPLIFFDPGNDLKGVDCQSAQQIDIYPTVMEYLNIPVSVDIPGHNLFDPDQPKFSISIINECYQFTMDRMLYQYDGESVIAIYDLESDPLEEYNLVANKSDYTADIDILRSWIKKYQH